MYHTETAQKNGKCYQTCARQASIDGFCVSD